MSGAIPPLLQSPSWRGAQLKHRDNFSFTYINCSGYLTWNYIRERSCVVNLKELEISEKSGFRSGYEIAIELPS
jgi:hypothetical protein